MVQIFASARATRLMVGGSRCGVKFGGLRVRGEVLGFKALGKTVVYSRILDFRVGGCWF